MAEPPNDVYTPKELAMRLKMPLKTVLAYLRQGRLPGIKIGKHWRVPRADLEAWFAEGRQGRPSVQGSESSPLDAINANIAHLP
jgi:excisionase family DNA binding protein